MEMEIYASFSSQGSAIQLTHKPDVAARGSGSYVINSSNQISQSNGTSFSSPILAGGVASLSSGVTRCYKCRNHGVCSRVSLSIFESRFFSWLWNSRFSICFDLGLRHQYAKQLEFEVFPNPVHQNLFIKFP